MSRGVFLAIAWLLVVITASVIVLERQHRARSELRDGCLGVHINTILGLILAITLWLTGNTTFSEASQILLVWSVSGAFLCLAYWVSGPVLGLFLPSARSQGQANEQKPEKPKELREDP